MFRKILTLFICSALFVGCATTQQGQPSKTATGAAIGAVVGGVAGAVTGPKHGKAKRVLIGAAAGAIIGGTIGYILDQQAKSLGDDLGVQPVDNTQGTYNKTPISKEKPVAVVKDPEKVRVVIKDSVLFNFDSYELRPSAKDTIRKIANTINQDPSNVIVVAGFTDSTGSFKYNVSLSEKRAMAVKNELVLNGVDPSRILTFGCGPKKPIAPNDSKEGRALNRRVEIYVYPRGARIPHPCE